MCGFFSVNITVCWFIILVSLQLTGSPQAIAADSSDSAKVAKKKIAFAADVCRIVEVEAKRNRLPAAFFARLIWKESRFNPRAVSPKGAQGIAQFMPGTALMRGLSDPFNYAEALPASAHYLSELRDKFGNVGLAAAAYNAGEGRVRRWLAARSTLPWETQDFVRSITGLPAHAWAKKTLKSPEFNLADDLSFGAACQKLAFRQIAPIATRARPKQKLESGPWKPWGVQLAAHFSLSRALMKFKSLQQRYASAISERKPMVVRARNAGVGRRSRYNIRLGEENRHAALKLCSQLRKLGGACVVVKNGR